MTSADAASSISGAPVGSVSTPVNWNAKVFATAVNELVSNGWLH